METREMIIKDCGEDFSESVWASLEKSMLKDFTVQTRRHKKSEESTAVQESTWSLVDVCWEIASKQAHSVLWFHAPCGQEFIFLKFSRRFVKEFFVVTARLFLLMASLRLLVVIWKWWVRFSIFREGASNVWAFRTRGDWVIFSVNLRTHRLICSRHESHYRFENDGVRLLNLGILSKWDRRTL